MRRPRDSPCLEPLEDRQLLSYTITNLGSLGGTFSVPVEVNNHGEVVGYSDIANNAAAHAFLYSHGKMTDLGALGVANSVATGINDRGVVVGMSNTTRGSKQFYAYLEQDGKITNLGAVNQAAALDGKVSINSSGNISGLSTDGNDAVIYRRGRNVDLGSLAGLGSIARDLNNSGDVVGLSPTAFHPAANSSSQPTVIFHAFEFSHGKMRDLGTLGGTQSLANSINDRGAVVGYSSTAKNAASHAFLYSRGKMTDLGTLGGRYSMAKGINDQGAVVGDSLTAALVSHGFVDLRGRMIDLNNLIPANSGIVITSAENINNRGQIIANGYKTGTPTVNLALLLSPTRSAR
jgi:probable HAF family extracellular repeat protein